MTPLSIVSRCKRYYRLAGKGGAIQALSDKERMGMRKPSNLMFGIDDFPV